MAYEELEALPRGLETPNVYGPADTQLSVQESQLIGSVRKNDIAFKPYTPTRENLRIGSLAEPYNIATVIDRPCPAEYISTFNALKNGATVTFYIRFTSNTTRTILSTLIYFGTVLEMEVTNSSSGALSVNIYSSSPYELIAGTIGTGSNLVSHFFKEIAIELNPSIGTLKIFNRSNANRKYHLVVPITSLTALSNMPTADTTSLSTISYGSGATFSVELGEYRESVFRSRARRVPQIPQQPLLPSKVGVPGLIEQSKRPWTSQPQQINSVNRDSFPGRPIVYASRVSDGCFDLISNKFPVGVSANPPSNSVSSIGIAGEFVPANSQYYNVTTATNLVSGYPLTVACWARIDSITAGGVMYSLNGTGYSAILGLLSSAFLVNQVSAANTNIVNVFGTDLGWHHIVCVHRSNTFSLYVDGILRPQGAASNYWGQPVAGNHSIGNRLNGSSPQYFDGAIQDLYVFQGELTGAEAKSLYRNHWQVFKPLSYKQFVGKNTPPNIQVYREKLVWTSQPQQAVGIDWSNPITRGLVIAFNHPSKLDHAKNRLASVNGTVTSSANGVSFGESSSLSVTDTPLEKFTIVSGAFASASTGTLFSRTSGSGGAYRQNYVLSLNGGTTPRFGFETSGSYPYIASSISVSSGAFVVAAASYDGATQKVYTNGISGGSQAAATPTTSIASVDTQVGAVDGTDRAVRYTGAGIKFAYLWNRALSDAEISSISRNPWQIFKPITRRIENRTPLKPQPFLPKYNPWVSQPQQSVVIDWDNPLATGLSTAFVFSNGLTDIVTNRQATNLGCQFGVSPLGISLIPTTAGILLPWNLDFTSYNIAVTVVEFRLSPPTNWWYILDNRASGTGYIHGQTSNISAPNGSLVSSGVKISTFCKDEFWQNGVRTNSPIGTYLMPSSNVRLFCRNNNVEPYDNTKIAAVFIHKRNLSNAEAVELYRNPWQIFKPIKYPARLK